MSDATPSLLGRIYHGMRIALIALLGFPFIIVLMMFWPIYSLAEQAGGRGRPNPPWKPLVDHWLGRTPKNRGFTLEEESSFSEVTDEAAQPAMITADGKQNKTSQEVTAQGEEGIIAPQPMALPEGRGHVALVTGGSGRLGAELVEHLARRGYRVGFTYYENNQRAESLVTALSAEGLSVVAMAVDLRSPTSMEGVLNQLIRRWGRLDLLVQSAARFIPTPLNNPTWEVMEGLFKINTIGPLWMAMEAAKRMKSHGDEQGQIIQIGDIWGERPLTGHAAYSASKAALQMGGKSLAKDLAPEVRVNSIAPGAVFPLEDSSPEGERRLHNRTPLTAQATPEAVLRAVDYLVTTPFVTGIVIPVDGGRMLQ
uniref:Putative Short-chain dehydrogenase/reductase n=1 Tax=Magnetococcus massalia (strain MO-1) TaxID=451514 RepID=A0A1S7LF72_MAGMO|nr:putative Short-chain dehydrogenase/reductase [Candidatus Magnetococcus massalia]